MPKLILFPGCDDETVIELGATTLAVGRGPKNDIRVNRRMASRQHAVIEAREDRYYLRDRDSFNGTFLNEQPVHDEVALTHGDVFRIADRKIRFVDLGAATNITQTLRLQNSPDLQEELWAIGDGDTDPRIPLQTANDKTAPNLENVVAGAPLTRNAAAEPPAADLTPTPQIEPASAAAIRRVAEDARTAENPVVASPLPAEPDPAPAAPLGLEPAAPAPPRDERKGNVSERTPRNVTSVPARKPMTSGGTDQTIPLSRVVTAPAAHASSASSRGPLIVTLLFIAGAAAAAFYYLYWRPSHAPMETPRPVLATPTPEATPRVNDLSVPPPAASELPLAVPEGTESDTVGTGDPGHSSSPSDGDSEMVEPGHSGQIAPDPDPSPSVTPPTDGLAPTTTPATPSSPRANPSPTTPPR